LKRAAVIVGAVRTPMGRLGGALSGARPDDLAALVIAEVLRRHPVDPKEIDDVVFGCANQAGEDNRNVARMAALLAGLPDSVPGITVNRLCASGLDAVNQAARAILSGEGDVFIAGGVESMSRAPYAIAKASKGFPFGNLTAYDTALGWRFPNPKMEKLFPLETMGQTAENIAEKTGISRAAQDGFALRSHQRAVAARARFKAEIVGVPVREGETVTQDEPPRADTSLERLSVLPATFRKGGSVTAGNSSSLNDGAAAVLIIEESKAKALGLQPMARFAGSAAAGVDPRTMGFGPVPATQKLLKRLGLQTKDLDLVELNEAFAVQALACARELGIDEEKLNVNGGAIALGHPLGCSGARLVTTLVHEMKRRGSRRGLATLCVGVGQGVAAVLEAP